MQVLDVFRHTLRAISAKYYECATRLYQRWGGHEPSRRHASEPTYVTDSHGWLRWHTSCHFGKHRRLHLRRRCVSTNRRSGTSATSTKRDTSSVADANHGPNGDSNRRTDRHLGGNAIANVYSRTDADPSIPDSYPCSC